MRIDYYGVEVLGMGLFGGNKEACSICGGQKGVKQIADGYVCKDCIAKCGVCLITLSWKDIFLKRVKDAINDNEINQQRSRIFHQTKVIEKELLIDEQNRLWKLKSYGNLYFTYGDIINYECQKNGIGVLSVGVGSALVGGLLFGGVGAILGGLSGSKKKEEINEFKIIVNLYNNSYHQLSINLLPTGKVKSDSIIFKSYCEKAEKIMLGLSNMGGLEKSIEGGNNAEMSPADEILKYKSLLDAGAITQEEYEAKKRQLLGL